MNGYPSCKTCAAFFRRYAGATQGECRARPPVPVMIGITAAAPPPVISMKNGGAPQPVINGFFPPTSEGIWCMEWQGVTVDDNKTIEHEALA